MLLEGKMGLIVQYLAEDSKLSKIITLRGSSQLIQVQYLYYTMLYHNIPYYTVLLIYYTIGN